MIIEDLHEGTIINRYRNIVPSNPDPDFKLRKSLRRGILAYGFDKPSDIQQKTLNAMIWGRDVLAQAQSGTGKTGAFVIGALQRINQTQRQTQVIILTPALELAQQIFDVVKGIGQYMKIEAFCCIGGTSMAETIEKCKQGVHIIIATPGRLIDMIQNKYLDTIHLKLLVVDEADQMLDHGFIENIAEILKLIPGDVQIGIQMHYSQALFSATFPLQVIATTKQFLIEPVQILVKKEQLTLEGIRQFYIAISDEDMKYKTLVELYKNLTVSQSILFCNSKKTVDELTDKLRGDSFTVSKIHSFMDQTEREQVLREFKSGAVRILVSTDLMSRGIDVQQLELVINYDFPRGNDQYIHRIGRAGRYGRNGVGINMISPAEAPSLMEVEKFYNIIIEEMPRDVGKIGKHLNINKQNNFHKKIEKQEVQQSKRQQNIFMQPQKQIDIESENLIETQVEIVEKFEELNLKNDLLLGIFAYGFDKPSVIQQKTLNAIIQGRDVLAQAQSGTGKTGAFVIGALQRIDLGLRKTQVIILAPAEELAKQIFDVVKGIGQYMNIEAVCCIGDTSMAQDMEKCKQGVHIIIATPGRLVEMIKRQYLDTVHMKLLVIDEADLMLDHGFIENILEILSLIPQDVQIGIQIYQPKALFSTTFSLQIIQKTKHFLRDPVKILIRNEQLTLERIREFYLPITQNCIKDKRLLELYNNLTIIQSIVFCNSTQTVDEVTEKLRGNNLIVSQIHQNMNQTEREQVLRDFKNGSVRILVSTDLMGRGIDIQQLSLVINYDFPRLKEQYLHRIGRAGRYGNYGVAINMISLAEVSSMMEVEKFYNTRIKKLPRDLAKVEKDII